MTLDPLSSASGTLSSLSGVSPTAGAVAAAGARSLALGVASEVGGHLLATLSGPVVTGQGAPQPTDYGIAALAEVLGQATGATPMEVLDIEQALTSLAGAVAADLVALADGRTLDRLDDAVSAMGPDDTMPNPANVSERIHTLATLLDEAR